MFEGISNWSYQKKTRLAELVYLLILTVIIPVTVGLQLFGNIPYTLSYIFLNILQIPAILVFYRWFLPRTLFNKRYWLFLAGLPVYFLVYELNARLSYFIAIY